MKSNIFTNTLRIFIATVTIFILAASPSMAAKKNDNPSPYVHFHHGIPHFKVASDGQQYHHVSGTEVGIYPGTIGAQFIFDAPGNDRIKSYNLQLRLKYITRNGLSAPYAGDKVSGDYGALNRPKSVNKPVTFALPLSNEVRDYFIDACNDLASRLRQHGLTDTEIFSQARMREIDLYASSAIDIAWVAGQGFESATPPPYEVKIPLTCMAQPGLQPVATNEFSVPSQVTESHLFLREQANIGGFCQVGLTPLIKTNLPNVKVRYRFEHSNGNKSKIRTITTNNSLLATDSEQWYDIPNNEGQDIGSVRVIGVSHDFQSSWQNYTINCHTGGPDTLVAETLPNLSTFTLKPENIETHSDWLCPTTVQATATLENEVDFTGRGYVVVKADGYNLDYHDISLLGGVPRTYWESIELKPWNITATPAGTLTAQPGGNAGVPFQRLEVKYVLQKTANDSVSTLFETPYETISVRCHKAQVNPDVTVGVDKLNSENTKNTVRPPQHRLNPPVAQTGQDTSPKGEVAHPQTITKQTSNRIDIAVKHLTVKLRPNLGTATATVSNLGQVETTFSYNWEIKANSEKKTRRETQNMTLQPRETKTIRHTFRAGNDVPYSVSLSVKAEDDWNRRNDKKKITTSVPKVSSPHIPNASVPSKRPEQENAPRALKENQQKVEKRVDIAVGDLKMKLTHKKGILTGTLNNLGNLPTSFRATMLVTDEQNKAVLRVTKQFNLQPGASTKIRERFSVKENTVYDAVISVIPQKDQQLKNNKSSVTATSPAVPKSNGVKGFRSN